METRQNLWSLMSTKRLDHTKKGTSQDKYLSGCSFDFLCGHTFSIFIVNAGPQLSEWSYKIINMTVVKWTIPANMVACTYSQDNASSHRQFRTSSLQEGFRLLYPDTPWFKHWRVKSSAWNVKEMYSPTFLIHSSPCLGYMKGLKR